MPNRIVRVICACLLSAIATPAYAWFGDGWIEKLSGPGPFSGFTADLRILCIALPSARVANPMGPGEHLRWEINERASVSGLGCHYLKRDAPRLEVGVQYSRYSAGGDANLLDYSHRPDMAGRDRGVRMGLWMATVDIRVNHMVDVGTAFGRARFGSPDGVFHDFGRWEFDPFRVSLRPLSAVSDARWAEMLNLRMEGRWFIGGFDGDDFGARPGTFSERGELVLGWSIVADLGPLFWGH